MYWKATVKSPWNLFQGKQPQLSQHTECVGYVTQCDESLQTNVFQFIFQVPNCSHGAVLRLFRNCLLSQLCMEKCSTLFSLTHSFCLFVLNRYLMTKEKTTLWDLSNYLCSQVNQTRFEWGQAENRSSSLLDKVVVPNISEKKKWNSSQYICI